MTVKSVEKPSGSPETQSSTTGRPNQGETSSNGTEEKDKSKFQKVLEEEIKKNQ